MGGLFGGGGKSVSTSETAALGLRVQTSVQGLAIPLVYGRTRIPANILWYDDFTAIPHTTTQKTGGKSGGGSKSTNTTYTYTASFVLGLCEGPITSINSVWRDKDFLSSAATYFTRANGTYPQTTWSYLTTKHPTAAIPYQGIATASAAGYDLGASPTLANHTFDVTARLPYAAGTIDDANPADILVDLLTSQHYGAGFPSGKIGSLTAMSNYCVASGLFFSPAYSDQREAREIITSLAKLANCGVFYSEGQLKVVPYGDQTVTGNSVTFTPNVTPLYDLTDEDFIAAKGEPPVRVTRTGQADSPNQLFLEFANRANQYNYEPVEAKDQASIDLYGLRPMSPVSAHEIADLAVARRVVQQMLQRETYVRNQYEFTIGPQYCLLEQMDIVTLTDTVVGLNRTAVRIISIKEADQDRYTIVAEDFPAGTGHAATYGSQVSAAFSINLNADAPATNTPIIFDGPTALTNGNPEVWIAASGPAGWGGADVWVSLDGTTYRQVGTVVNPARTGVLSANFPSGSDPDTVNSCQVDLSSSLGSLLAGTSSDADNYQTLCYVGGEFIAYSAATLTGTNRYSLGTYIRRGLYGSIASHSAGAVFARIDDAVYRLPYDPSLKGKTLYVKLPSINPYAGGRQDVSAATAYTYTIGGQVAPPAPTGLAATAQSGYIHLEAAGIDWTKVDVVEYWASATNDRTVAVKVGEARASVFDHVVASGSTRWYWARTKNGVTPNGTDNVSTWFPNTTTSTVTATSSTAGTGPAGANAVSLQLTRTAVTLAADSSGNVSSFAAANGVLTVFDGVTDVTASATLSVVASTNATGTVNTAANTPVASQPKGYYQVTALSADTGDITLQAVYGGNTYVAKFTLAKARAGTNGTNGSNGTNGTNGTNGANAVALNLTRSSAQVFAYADGSVPSYTGLDGVLTVFDGTTDATASATLSVAGTNCSGTINTAANSPVSGQPKGYYQVTALSADVGTLTITAVYGGNTYTRSFSVSKVKTGYEIVGTLPSSNLFQGRIVLLTTDNKLYRYTGSAWTTAVDGADILANSILTNAIGAGQVTASKIGVSQLSAIAADVGTVTAGLLQDSTGKTKLDLNNSRLIFDNGTYMMVEGIGFGAGSNYLLWYGPTQSSASNYAACTDALGLWWVKTDGTSFMGGQTRQPTISIRDNTSGTTETIPANVSTVTIELWGCTGFGGHGNTSAGGTQGGGGGSGAYCRSVYSVVGQNGRTFTVSLPAGGVTTAATISAGTFSGFTAMSAPGGGNGGIGGVSTGGSAGTGGSIASGGNVVNAEGNDGNRGDPDGPGGGGPVVTGIYGIGKKGPNGSFSNTTNNSGRTAIAVFTYT